MFKGNLIESQDYYRFRKREGYLSLISLAPAIVVLGLQLPKSYSWVVLLMLILLIIFAVMRIRNQKQIGAIFGKKIIEIDENQIRIMSKKGNLKEHFDLNQIDKLIFKGDISKYKETGNTFNEKPIYIIIIQGNKSKRFDFKLDSHYMTNQLNKAIDSWKTKEYNFETIAS